MSRLGAHLNFSLFLQLGMVVHTYNLSAQEAKAGRRTLNSRPAWRPSFKITTTVSLFYKKMPSNADIRPFINTSNFLVVQGELFLGPL
jgi:hypothetical protein